MTPKGARRAELLESGADMGAIAVIAIIVAVAIWAFAVRQSK